MVGGRFLPDGKVSEQCLDAKAVWTAVLHISVQIPIVHAQHAKQYLDAKALCTTVVEHFFKRICVDTLLKCVELDVDV